ncbi:MAG: universal stress protein [Sphingobacteriia bacterium]|nr:universal stress protein [Sphingobacteriia bacterium]NCC39605.1 universal stress protein [Gammaproteobacteria bacterium]
MSVKRLTGPVLVPVDFSPTSEAALLQAAELAMCLQRELLVLHVVHDPGSMPGYYSRALKKKQLHRIEDGASAMLDDLMESIIRQHPQIKDLSGFHSMLVKGLPSSRIIEVATQTQASMIVIGSRGLTGLKHLLIGSVAERVVHLARIPVMVVKSAECG